MATCHVKARKQNETSGIIKREIPIRADKVQLYCSTCKKGVRVGFKLDGDKKVRVCKKCGKEHLRRRDEIMARLKVKYTEEIAPALMKKFQL